MWYFNININPLTGIKKHVNCTFKPQNTLPKMVVKHRHLDSHPPLHHFNVETANSLNSSWLNNIIAMISIMIALTFIWWLTNSNASIPLISPASSVLTTNLVVPTEIISLEIPAKLPKIPNISITNHASTKLPWLHLKIKPGDTLASIFQKNKLKQLYQVTQIEHSKQLRQLKINQELHIKYDIDKVQDLILILNKTDELHVFRTETKEFESEIRPIGRTTKIVTIHGVVKTTLSAAIKQSGLSSQQLNKLMDIFVYDIDFERDIQIGDQFSVIYKQHQFGKDIEEGDILVAEFINQNKLYQALRYTDQAGNTDYYTPAGASLQKISLLSTPITDFKRLSSHFGIRKHPVSGRKHLHTGIDYSAVRGTPIIAAGDAIIKFLGRKGGYGKVIILEHDSRVRTLYAHMSKFVKSLKVGTEVSQGEIIGYVGMTGRTTGSHLHYEVLIDNDYKNPLDFKQAFSLPIVEPSHFFQKTKKLLAQLNAINQASAPIKLAQSMTSTLKLHATVIKE
ncbi:MAG: M23 family metallopeptidase [Candidatus Marithrix sp.]